MAVAVSLAAALTAWAIAEMAYGLRREEADPPWGLYSAWISLLVMVWSGLSLLLWRTNFAIALLIVSALYGLPLGALAILLHFGD